MLRLPSGSCHDSSEGRATAATKRAVIGMRVGEQAPMAAARQGLMHLLGPYLVLAAVADEQRGMVALAALHQGFAKGDGTLAAIQRKPWRIGH